MSEVIAILGTGAVGSALTARLTETGFEVRLGSREPGQTVEGVTSRSYRDACSGATIVFVAVPAENTTECVEAAEIAPGTVIVDCTNPLRVDDGPVHAPPPEGSVAAELAAAHPELRIVKGFCTFGARRHRHPDLDGTPTDVHLASDDDEAKQRVTALATTAGFRPLDCGPLRNAAVLENLAVLWIELAHKAGLGRNFAFIAVDEEEG